MYYIQGKWKQRNSIQDDLGFYACQLGRWIFHLIRGEQNGGPLQKECQTMDSTCWVILKLHICTDGSDCKESDCQCRIPGFDPWVGKIPWRREQLPTPVFWPGEFHGQWSLVGYSPCGGEESDTTEQLSLSYDLAILLLGIYLEKL